MLIFDAHLDVAMNAINLSRDYTLPVEEIRRREQEKEVTRAGGGRGTVSYPILREGEVGVMVVTVIARVDRPGNPLPGFSTSQAAYGAAQGQLAYYRAREAQGILRLLTTRGELDAHLVEWERDPQNTPFGVILSAEGADPIITPEWAQKWWDDGLRAVGLSHYGVSNYAHGTSTPGGLTDLGPALLKEMDRLGMVLDTTHLADDSFWECMDLFQGPVCASHQNCRALVSGDRQFTDDQIKAVVERGGVLGQAYDAWMLYEGWVKGETSPEVLTQEAVVDHIDYVCQLAGNSLHAGIGTDLDGGYGTEQTPGDLDTIADLQRVPELLTKRGYMDQDIRNIMHGNWIRFYREALPA